MRWLIVALVLIASSSTAQTRYLPHKVTVETVTGACTDGVDCYCDRVTDSGDPIYDASLLFCEDFENDDYYLNTANSMVAGSGSPYNRGIDSTWYAIYGQPSFKGNLTNADPTPDIGTACGQSVCAGTRTYCSAAQGALTPAGTADCWGPGINDTSQLWIMRSGDFNDEIGSLTLTGGIGATADIGDGNTSMAQRVPLGPNEGDGGTGQAPFGGNQTEVGVTQLFAFASNVSSSGVFSQPWKLDESGQDGTGDQPFLGMIGPGFSGDRDMDPFQPFLWTSSTSACNGMISGVTVNKGAISCITDTKLGMTPDGNINWGDWPTTGSNKQSSTVDYNRSTDWPYGTWGCVRSYISGMGTSNVTFKMWFNDTLIIDITGIDGTVLLENDYNNYWFNNYSNQSVGAGLSSVTYRYKDNLHVRAGVPVTCASMGFGA